MNDATLQQHIAFGSLVEKALTDHSRLRVRSTNVEELEERSQSLDDLHPRKAESES